jgi:hypothetical protein
MSVSLNYELFTSSFPSSAAVPTLQQLLLVAVLQAERNLERVEMQINRGDKINKPVVSVSFRRWIDSPSALYTSVRPPVQSSPETAFTTTAALQTLAQTCIQRRMYTVWGMGVANEEDGQRGRARAHTHTNHTHGIQTSRASLWSHLH